jgi:hypothetical protein
MLAMNDGAVDGEQVERPQGADLVNASREPSAAQDQGRLRLAAPAAPLTGLLLLVELDDLPH